MTMRPVPESAATRCASWRFRGVRARRRLCERGLVLVGGRPGVPGLKLRAGQEIVLLPDPGQKTAEAIALQIAGTRSADARGEHPFVVHAENGIAALFKPAGLHSCGPFGERRTQP